MASPPFRFFIMISSRYLYPVIVLVLAWTFSLFTVYNWATTEKPDPAQGQQLQVIQQASDELAMMQLLEIGRLEALLKDDSKARFSCLLPPLQEGQMIEMEVVKDINKKISLVSATSFSSDASHGILEAANLTCRSKLLAIATGISRMLDIHHGILNISAEDLLPIKNELNNIYNKFSTEQATPHSLVDATRSLMLMELDFKSCHVKLQRVLTRSFSGRILSCGPSYLPILVNSKQNITLNSEANLEFAVALFDPPGKENLRLIVGTDTLAMEESWTFSVSAKTNRIGKQTDTATLLIRNPFTGERSMVESSFSYYVSPN